MTKSQTFLDMSSKRDMMIFIYFSIFFLIYNIRLGLSFMFRLFISSQAPRVLPETECHPNLNQNINQTRLVLISVL